MHHHDTIKIIPKAYLSNQECSLQEAVYHILAESKLRRDFSADCLVNTNPPQERVQVLKSEKELIEFPDDSPNILRNLILIDIWKDQMQHSAI